MIDGLYWLGETLSELGDLKRARRAYLGVAERSVGEMRGWGLFKSSRLVSEHEGRREELAASTRPLFYL